MMKLPPSCLSSKRYLSFLKGQASQSIYQHNAMLNEAASSTITVTQRKMRRQSTVQSNSVFEFHPL